MEIVNFTTFQNKDILKILLNNFVFQKKKMICLQRCNITKK